MDQLYSRPVEGFAYAPASVRIQTGALANREKRVLSWLCKHLPAQVAPDHLTLLGAIGALIVFSSYVIGRTHPALLLVAIAGYLINWFGDSLDGSLARHRGLERKRYGYFLDHSIDAASIFLIMLGLGLSGYVHFSVAMLTLVAYLLMCIHVFLANPVTGRFQLTFLSAGPTELRIGLIILTLLMYFRIGEQHVWGFSYLGLFLSFNAAILIALFISNTLVTLRGLSKVDPPAPRPPKSNGPDYSHFWLSMAPSQSSAKNCSTSPK